jgi:hypothetical protein
MTDLIEEGSIKYTMEGTQYTGYPPIVRLADLRARAGVELEMKYARLRDILAALESKKLVDHDDAKLLKTTRLYWPTHPSVNRAFRPTRPPTSVLVRKRRR